MRLLAVLDLCLLAGFTAAAQTAPALSIDAAASVHPISPYVYGVNAWGDNPLAKMMRIPLARWGGDDATSYNWQTDVKNNTGDNPWCFKNYRSSPGFDQIHAANLAAGAVTMGTIPLMDWTPSRRRLPGSRTTSYSVPISSPCRKSPVLSTDRSE